GWDAKGKKWFEWGVTSRNGQFAWTRVELVEARAGRTQRLNSLVVQPPSIPAELLRVLPDGFSTEICPAAAAWWRQAAQIIGAGKLVALDYGLTTEELFTPERQQGTLRAYREHRLGLAILESPGEQDLTAHVNFSAIRETGETAGLSTEAFMT